MAADIPTTEPASLRVGDTWAWTKTVTDYPAPTWALSYTLVNATHKIAVTSTASGTDHAVSIAKATTAGYTAGTYRWQSSVTDGTSRYIIETGTITVEPDFSAQVTYDARSSWGKLYDSMETALAAYGSKAWTQEYALGNRVLRFRDNADFLAMYDRARSEKTREELADKLKRGLGGGQRVMVRL